MSTANRKADSIDAAPNWLGALPAPSPASLSLFFAGMARAAAWNIHMAEAMLQSSRHVLDVSRSLLRQQQDAALKAWREQLEAMQTDAEQIEMVAPFAAATKAAVEMSTAVLQAQRNAVQALSEQARSR